MVNSNLDHKDIIAVTVSAQLGTIDTSPTILQSTVSGKNLELDDTTFSITCNKSGTIKIHAALGSVYGYALSCVPYIRIYKNGTLINTFTRVNESQSCIIGTADSITVNAKDVISIRGYITASGVIYYGGIVVEYA